VSHAEKNLENRPAFGEVNSIVVPLLTYGGQMPDVFAPGSSHTATGQHSFTVHGTRT